MDIRIKSLNKVYRGDVRALDDINLSIEAGMFGLLGPNGAGKTTLMRILATLIKPSSGSATVGGLDVTGGRDKWAVKRLLGYLPQELSLYANLTVREFLDYMATLKEMGTNRQRSEEVGRVLELVGMEEMAGRRVKTLSGGMKRRIGIAQALLGDPKFLIVDEPTAGLDPEERVRFRTLLAAVSGQRIVILSTHIIEDIATTCHDMAVLRKGQLLFHGSPGELLHSAQDSVWELTMPPDRMPDPAWHVATSIRDAHKLRLRIVGPRPSADAEPTLPTLEEAYLVFMTSGAAGSASQSHT